MVAQTTGDRVTAHPGCGMLLPAMRCLMMLLDLGGRAGHGDSAKVIFVQILPAFTRKFLAMPTDEGIVAVLNFMDLSLGPDRVLIVAPTVGHGFVDPLFSVRSGDHPAWIAADFRALKPNLIGSLVVIAAVAMPESFVHTLALAAATVMWQLAIALGLAVLGPLLAASDRRDKEWSKE